MKPPSVDDLFDMVRRRILVSDDGKKPVPNHAARIGVNDAA
jgi:hypothetical protein